MRSSLGTLTSPPIVAERQERKYIPGEATAKLEKLREEKFFALFSQVSKTEKKPVREKPEYDFR